MDKDEESVEYNVEAIRGWRFNKSEQCKEYYIKWENYEEDANTWEPEMHLNCPGLMGEFVKKLSDSEQRNHGKSLGELNKLNGFERHAEFLRCIGPSQPLDKEDKRKFVCLIEFFDIPDKFEEIGFDEFYNKMPSQALEFIECRLIYDSQDEN